jgi:hypothetical protein
MVQVYNGLDLLDVPDQQVYEDFAWLTHEIYRFLAPTTQNKSLFHGF